MSGLIKILHIDPDYQITYLIYRPRTSIRTSVSLQSAIALLKKEDFDLIISEPHNKAILKKQPQFVEPKFGSADGQTSMKVGHGDFSEARSNRYFQERGSSYETGCSPRCGILV